MHQLRTDQGAPQRAIDVACHGVMQTVGALNSQPRATMVFKCLAWHVLSSEPRATDFVSAAAIRDLGLADLVETL